MSKILIVDDEEMMLMLAERILSQKYEIVTATTGEEAIELFERERPDMVLSVLMLPPVIFMSADESDETESKGFEVGAEDYIRKPFKPDVLLRRVGNIIDNLDKIHGLELAASTDALTKLLNKAATQKKIGELVKDAYGALLMVDLDSFKLVNDIYGHAAGDKILIRFAELIRRMIRENDVAGRMGGDEFIVFLQNVSNEKILVDKTNFLNEQILIAAKNLLGNEMQIPLGVSVGAVFVPEEGKDFHQLYEKADAALYEVKQHGKHGISIFGEKNHAEKTSAVEGISQMRMILGERNVEAGAYFVEFETFKKIYRLLTRMAESYKKGLVLMQFTLAEEKSAEEFKDVVIHALRRSDCVTQSGKKFLVLLPEATELEADGVRNRIFSRLKNFNAREIIFEREKVS